VAVSIIKAYILLYLYVFMSCNYNSTQ